MWHCRRFFARLYALFHPQRAERELCREVASHLLLLEDEFQRKGMSPQEARQAARRAYGSVEQAKELHRDERSFVWLEQVFRDLRHACRNLIRTPGFTTVAVITLALGIGVNTTLFTAYNAVALRPLPVADPNEVVRLERWFESGSLGNYQYAFSYPEYVYCRDHNDVFASLVAASWAVPVFGTLSGESEKLRGQLVSANYFGALGVGAQLGRTFLPDEDRAPGANPVVVLSHFYWQRRLRGDPQVLGRTVKLNGTTFTVVGVAPEEFMGTSVDGLAAPDFWAPLSMQIQLAPARKWLNEPSDLEFQLLARLRPTTTLQRAQVQAAVLIRQFGETYKAPDRTKNVTLQHTTLLGNTEDIRFKALVAALMLIVGMVLLVACVNLANMLLARGSARQREIGVRLALGASRVRIIRHLLTESLILSLAGGIAGLVLSLWTSKLLRLAIEQMFAGGLFDPAAGAGERLNLTPDFRVFAYTLAVSLATGILFGLSPALQFSRPDLTTALKDEGTSLGRRLSRSRLRIVLVMSQVAVSLLLLITAGLLLRGLVRSQAADPGFETGSVFLVLGDFAQDKDEQRLLSHLQSLPAVRSVALGGYPMMGTWTPPIIVEAPRAGQSLLRGRTLGSYGTETYLDTLGISLLRGRRFTRQEAEKSEPVAIISESTARRFWPLEDALGKRFKLDMDFRGKLAEFEVIGIVKDVRFANLTRIDPAHVYLTPKPGDFNGMLLRVSGDPRQALDAVRSAVAEVDRNLLPSLSLISVEQGPQRLQKLLAQTYALFAAILASLALTLSGVGIYGVLAYLVSQRSREIGIRMALGASASGVLGAVVIQGLRPVFIGIFLGITGAAGLSWFLHTTLNFPGSTDLLYGVPFYDPATFLGLSGFLIGVAAIASAIPARRALKVDPMVALRCE